MNNPGGPQPNSPKSTAGIFDTSDYNYHLKNIQPSEQDTIKPKNLEKQSNYLYDISNQMKKDREVPVKELKKREGAYNYLKRINKRSYSSFFSTAPAAVLLLWPATVTLTGPVCSRSAAEYWVSIARHFVGADLGTAGADDAAEPSICQIPAHNNERSRRISDNTCRLCVPEFRSSPDRSLPDGCSSAGSRAA